VPFAELGNDGFRFLITRPLAFGQPYGPANIVFDTRSCSSLAVLVG